MLSSRRIYRKNIWPAWVLLLVGFVATAVAVVSAKRDVEAHAKTEFTGICSEIEIKINARLAAHAQILRSAAALFDASDEVTRAEWNTYTKRQKVEQNLPGIQGLGFSLVVPRTKLAEHIQSIRKEGFPDYRVKPAGDRGIYTAIIYLEPFSGRNLRAFGYDMFSEPVRRKAMEEARDLDVAALSGKVVLVQETDQDVQAGTLMYVPVYRKGMKTDTVADRRAAIRGWVYSPYRMKDLMQGISKELDVEALKRIRLQVFDHESLSPDSLLYDSQPQGEWKTTDDSRLVLKARITFNTHHWHLRFIQTGGLWNYGRLYGVLAGGLTISLLLFGLLLSLLNIRFKAQQMADRLTVDLRKSEEKYRLLIETAGEGILVAQDGRLKFVNPMILKWTGYPEEGLLSLPFLEFVHPEDRELVRENDNKRIQGKAVDHRYQFRLLGKDKRIRWVEMTGAGIEWDGEPASINFVADITERKRVEETLQQVTDRLTLAVQAGGVGIWDYDVVHNTLIWDDQMFRLYGITRSQFGGAYEAWQAGVHPEDRERSDEEIRLALRGEKDFNTEFRVLHPDGTVHTIRALGLVQRDASGRPLHMIGTNWDMSAQKRTETELRESELRVRSITDAAQDAILMMDFNGLISYWNPAAERILGYARAEAIGQDLHALLAPQRYHEAHRAAFSVFRRTGEGAAVDKTIELEARRKDGHEISVQLSLSAVEISGNWHAVGILSDITERKRAEAELLNTNMQLEAATSRANRMAAQATMASIAKSEFLANMSHEIRTPMNGIIGMTGLLIDTELTPEQRHYADIVRTSGESLLGLINNILDFSKIEANRLDLEVLEFDLAALLEDFAATLAVQAQAKGIELLCATDLDLPTLLTGDPGRLRQILTNLVANAVKFTPAGEVSIRVSLVEEDEREVVLRFCVRDTGIGIAAEKIGLLFSKFSQVDASTTRQYGGTGLGLAISKQLAELMGGRIGVESEVGRGSSFWFTIRLGKQAAGRVREVLPPADLQGVRVLIVDDNGTSREILTTRLASWGMRPSEAENGPGALELLGLAQEEGDPFGIAVIDMQMPGMDGETLGRRIREDSRMAGTRMVMLTSLGTRGDAKRFEKIGFAAYAVKPVRHQELREILALALAHREGAAPTARPIATRHTARETSNLFADRKVRILLAEDNITNQQVAIGILKKLGLRADAVANGAEALKALETIPYDLVLMDVQMPEMDGIEATGRIRDPQSAVRNHRIPIIAMTAHAMQGDRERCLSAGMDDYVSKPVTPKALADCLERWLPRNGAVATRQDPMGVRGAASRAAEEGEMPVFDRVGMRSRLMEDEELVRTVVNCFLEDIPHQITALRGYLASGDLPGAERQAHTIKGASANVGGECLREAAWRIEKRLKAGDLEGARGEMAVLDGEFERLQEAMKGEGIPGNG